jgi:hypothetical protein
LFKHCCYCIVRWTIYYLSVCRKIIRQYKHHLSCTLHYHRRSYRRIPVLRHFTVASLEMPQPSPTPLWTDTSSSTFHSSVPGNATTITDDFADEYQSVGIVSASHNYWQNHRQTVRIPKHWALNASLTTCICRRNYRRTAKNMEGN